MLYFYNNYSHNIKNVVTTDTEKTNNNLILCQWTLQNCM